MQEFPDVVQHACAVRLGSSSAAFYQSRQRVRKLLQWRCASADGYARHARHEDRPRGIATRGSDQRENDIQHEHQYRRAWQPSGKTANAAGTTNTSAASPAASGVQPASYQAGTNATKSTSLPAPPSGSALRLSGMPVNDATTSGAAAEPARFVPAGSPIEIAQLPPATPAPGTTPTSGTVVASAQASDPARRGVRAAVHARKSTAWHVAKGPYGLATAQASETRSAARLPGHRSPRARPA